MPGLGPAAGTTLQLPAPSAVADPSTEKAPPWVCADSAKKTWIRSPGCAVPDTMVWTMAVVMTGAGLFMFPPRVKAIGVAQSKMVLLQTALLVVPAPVTTTPVLVALRM